MRKIHIEYERLLLLLTTEKGEQRELIRSMMYLTSEQMMVKVSVMFNMGAMLLVDKITGKIVPGPVNPHAVQ